MDADHPLDSRSNVSVDGILDLPGDQKLNPYGDFKLDPQSPEKRPGYSH